MMQYAYVVVQEVSSDYGCDSCCGGGIETASPEKVFIGNGASERAEAYKKEQTDLWGCSMTSYHVHCVEIITNDEHEK